MPAVVLTTNVKPRDEAHEKELVLDLSKARISNPQTFSAQTLGKPEKYISVAFNYVGTLSFHGTFDPAFLLHITSLGNINPEVNEVYSKAFFEHFKEKLNIPGDRGYITFYDPGNAYLGHEGTTFATIFGKK
ncbi:macrophage migration inhibitory factor [Rhizoctonia solani]|uniref:L-dopachrome isomerase n=1 Tax=Rhizoctonia solani TaxID=456999 RepID=A0A8H8T3U7_9AGAM|nr:macrophage migration inhibitory factor [Rhizoctonia solani]QRW26908.1 macrophage migration inhibitory factor [Rhizoctonia solani]